MTVKQIYELDETNFKDFVNDASDQSRFSEAIEEAPMDSQKVVENKFEIYSIPEETEVKNESSIS